MRTASLASNAMTPHRALGDYVPHLTGVEHRWGPDNQWLMWMGGDVIKGLIDLLDAHLHLEQLSPGKSPTPADLGMVPWFTHTGLADRFKRMAVCIAVDKAQSDRAVLSDLEKGGAPFPLSAITWIPEVDEPWGELMEIVPDGQGGVTSGGTHTGPVRSIGYASGRSPLAHSKLLVAGTLGWFKARDFPDEDSLRFIPRFAWLGSANWTRQSANHLELAVASDDPGLMRNSLRYLSAVFRVSEPIDSGTRIPTDSMVHLPEPETIDDETASEWLRALDE